MTACRHSRFRELKTAFCLITIKFMTDDSHDFKNYLLLFLSFKFNNIECYKGKISFPSQDGQSLVFVSITQPSDSSEGFFSNIFDVRHTYS